MLFLQAVIVLPNPCSSSGSWAQAKRASLSSLRSNTVSLRSIADIFAEDGEEAFRDIETDVLRDLSQRSPRLIGCGGGVVTKRAENAEIMRDAGYVVYLQVTADEAARRIPNTDSRPMFKNLETARKTIIERIPQYEAAAHYAIDTEGREIVDLASEIAEQLLAEGIMVKEEAHE